MRDEDYVVTETRVGPRVHKWDCKRQGKGASLKAALKFAPGTVLHAKTASCCRPTGWEELIPDYLEKEPTTRLDVGEDLSKLEPEVLSEAKAKAREAAHRAQEKALVKVESMEDNHDHHISEYDLAVADDPEFDGAEGTVETVSQRVDFEGAAKYYAPYMIEGGAHVATALGVGVERYRSHLVLTGTPEDVKDVEETLLVVWMSSQPTFRRWKRENNYHRHLTKKQKWDRETAFLRDFCIGAAAFFAGVEPKQGMSDGFRAGFSAAFGDIDEDA